MTKNPGYGKVLCRHFGSLEDIGVKKFPGMTWSVCKNPFQTHAGYMMTNAPRKS
jgi:hypothetical protein